MMILEAPPLGGEQELAWALEMVLALQPTSLEKDHQAWGLHVAASVSEFSCPGALDRSLQPPGKS